MKIPEILVTELNEGPALVRLSDQFEVVGHPDRWRDLAGLKAVKQDANALQELDVSRLGFHELLEITNFVFCHLPRTTETLRMF